MSVPCYTLVQTTASHAPTLNGYLLKNLKLFWKLPIHQLTCARQVIVFVLDIAMTLFSYVLVFHFDVLYDLAEYKMPSNKILFDFQLGLRELYISLLL